ncbi:integrase core domain-containing protein [Streptomyces sp. NPDC059455]|uniref:integrase core domain-containing protein n=1 Tax=Streptomyces sp. NPDC059455 TaxID=3346837 RepID=UPI0036B946B8
MNAHCERIIGSIRREALDHILIMNETHARHALAAYERHYNQHRPHQARNQLPPEDTPEQPSARHDFHTHKVEHTRILGASSTSRDRGREPAKGPYASRLQRASESMG